MAGKEITALILISAFCLFPILWGISTWLWIKAHWRARAAAGELEQVRSRAIASAAELVQAKGLLAAAEMQLNQLRERFRPVLNLDDELALVAAQINEAKATFAELRLSYTDRKAIYDRLVAEVAVFDERLAFGEMGVYEPHFDFSDSEEYKSAIEATRAKQKKMISAKTAVFCKTEWTIEGSKAKGQTMINRVSKLTLRAFNNECDAAIGNARWNNVNAMEKRIVRAKEQIDNLNESLNIIIGADFLQSKLDELFLTHEYREKLKAEKDERAEAARLAREEQKLQRDMEDAQAEEEHYARLLERAKAEAAGFVGDKLDAFREQIDVLEHDLAAAHEKAERARSLAERTRSGYVYVVSNIGSFGDGVIKIGLTRRLDPVDRIRELGDASVPFTFDTHAIIYSDDAPSLEKALHGAFESTRINIQNYRKEFFRAGIDEVETVVRRLSPNASFFKDIEAQEYRETLSRRQMKLKAEAPREALPAAL